MEQIWIYVILGIIYFIVRLVRERAPKDGQDQRPDRPVKQDSTPPINKPKQLTFEELLREITEAKQPQKPVYEPRPSYETIPPKEEYVDYDDQIGEEAQDLEDVNYDYRKRNKIYSEYDEAKQMAFKRPSLEETLNVRDTDMTFGKFKEFDKVQQRNYFEEYVIDFKDPEALRKAVVMSEILKRKF